MQQTQQHPQKRLTKNEHQNDAHGVSVLPTATYDQLNMESKPSYQHFDKLGLLELPISNDEKVHLETGLPMKLSRTTLALLPQQHGDELCKPDGTIKFVELGSCSNTVETSKSKLTWDELPSSSSSLTIVSKTLSTSPQTVEGASPQKTAKLLTRIKSWSVSRNPSRDSAAEQLIRRTMSLSKDRNYNEGSNRVSSASRSCSTNRKRRTKHKNSEKRIQSKEGGRVCLKKKEKVSGSSKSPRKKLDLEGNFKRNKKPNKGLTSPDNMRGQSKSNEQEGSHCGELKTAHEQPSTPILTERQQQILHLKESVERLYRGVRWKPKQPIARPRSLNEQFRDIENTLKIKRNKRPETVRDRIIKYDFLLEMRRKEIDEARAKKILHEDNLRQTRSVDFTFDDSEQFKQEVANQSLRRRSSTRRAESVDHDRSVYSDGKQRAILSKNSSKDSFSSATSDFTLTKEQKDNKKQQKSEAEMAWRRKENKMRLILEQGTKTSRSRTTKKTRNKLRKNERGTSVPASKVSVRFEETEDDNNASYQNKTSAYRRRRCHSLDDPETLLDVERIRQIDEMLKQTKKYLESSLGFVSLTASRKV